MSRVAKMPVDLPQGVSATIGAAARLPAAAYLSLNASPELCISGRLGALLAPVTRPIVLEITEHVAIEDYEVLRKAGTDEFKAVQ